MAMAQISIAYGQYLPNPAYIPDISGWWIAANDGTPYFNKTNGNGGTITQWIDQSGNSHNGNQTGNASRRPTWQSNIQNGLGAVLFNVNDNETSNFLTANPYASLQGLSSYTVFIVARTQTLSATPVMLTSDFNEFKFSWNNFYTISGPGAVATSTVAGDTTKFHIFMQIFDGTRAGNANRLRFRYDAVDQALTYSGTVGTTTNASTNTIDFAVDATGGSNFWNGYMGEAAIINRALTATEITELESYANNTWALGLNI